MPHLCHHGPRKRKTCLDLKTHTELLDLGRGGQRWAEVGDHGPAAPWLPAGLQLFPPLPEVGSSSSPLWNFLSRGEPSAVDFASPCNLPKKKKNKYVLWNLLVATWEEQRKTGCTLLAVK